MILFHNELWKRDLDEIIRENRAIDSLAGRSVLITGASGLICSAIAEVLFRYNDTHREKIRIIAAGRNEKAMADRLGELVEREEYKFIPFDASNPAIDWDGPVDYIVYGASNASPGKIVKEPVETMAGNILGLKCLLDYAKNHGVKRVLYISSSEIYGQKERSEPFREDQYGFIDLLKPRNSYSVAKRAAETLCISYTDEYSVETVIARPGHIYGPTASEDDNRVSSAWAYAAARGEDIIMKSEGKQIRSYCYCLDCASAILTILLRGETGHAYNISNPDSIISIREMAGHLAEMGDVQLMVILPSETEKKGFNPMQNSSLESHSLSNLGWKGCFDAKRGFSHTVRILREEMLHSGTF